MSLGVKVLLMKLRLSLKLTSSYKCWNNIFILFWYGYSL